MNRLELKPAHKPVQNFYTALRQFDDLGVLFFCELRASALDPPVLAIFHSTWKPKAGVVLFEGTFTRFNPDEWQSDFEVVLPPAAWYVEGGWSGFE